MEEIKNEDPALELLINAQKFLSSQSDDVLIRELKGRGYYISRLNGDIDMKQVSMITGFSVSALRKKHWAGQMPQGYKIGTRTLRFTLEEIHGWIDQKRKQQKETFVLRPKFASVKRKTA